MQRVRPHSRHARVQNKNKYINSVSPKINNSFKLTYTSVLFNRLRWNKGKSLRSFSTSFWPYEGLKWAKTSSKLILENVPYFIRVSVIKIELQIDDWIWGTLTGDDLTRVDLTEDILPGLICDFNIPSCQIAGEVPSPRNTSTSGENPWNFFSTQDPVTTKRRSGHKVTRLAIMW